MLVTGGWNQSVLVRITTSRHQSCSLGTGLPRFRPGSCPSGQELVKFHSSRKPRPAAHLSAPEQMFGQKGQPVPDKTVSPDSVTARSRIWSSAPGKLSQPSGAATSQKAKAGRDV